MELTSENGRYDVAIREMPGEASLIVAVASGDGIAVALASDVGKPGVTPFEITKVPKA